MGRSGDLAGRHSFGQIPEDAQAVESFEQFVAVAMEAEGLIVSETVCRGLPRAQVPSAPGQQVVELEEVEVDILIDRSRAQRRRHRRPRGSFADPTPG